jgi:cellulose synthase operon protein C
MRRARSILLCALLVSAALQVAACGSREDRAQTYYENGLKYLEKQDFVKARIELRNAVQLRPNMVEAWRSLVKIDEHDRNVQGIVGDLLKISELDDKDINTRVRLATIYLGGGALNEALKQSNAAAEIDPKSLQALGVKAATLFRLKDIDGATQTAQKALEIDPGNVNARVVLASIKFLQGDADSALKILADVSAAQQEDLGVVFLKANIFQRKGDFAQVEKILRGLIALHPNEVGFRNQLIRFLLAQKRPDDAIAELRSVVATNPADVNAELQLVNLLGMVKGADTARNELVARINGGGSILPYQLALARLDFARGNSKDSTQLLGKIISGASSPDDVLAAQTTLAELYMSKNDVAEAEPVIADILRKDSRNLTGLRLRAGIRINRGQIDDAISDLRTALNDQPRSAELLGTLAIAYERSGSIELADKAFLDATRASGFGANYGMNYVAFLQRRGLSDRSEAILNDLVSRNPNNVAILSALAQVKLRKRDWAGAHTLADAIRRLGDKNDLADRINGAALFGERKFDESAAALQNSYDANPAAVQPMAALVSVYLQAKQIDKAQAFLQDALKANPSNAEALVLMGSVQLAKNNPTEAQKYFEAAITKQPKDPGGYKVLADFYARQGKADDALKIVESGLQQQPKSFDLLLAKAGLLEITQQYEAAITEYQSMMKDQPGSMIIANNLASLLADHRTDKQSLAQAGSLSALLKNSDIPQFKDTLGWISYLQGDNSSALSLLKDAAAKLPNSSAVQFHLGMSYLAAGQDTDASERFKKAMELAPKDAELKAKIDAALKGRPEKVKG